MLWCSSASLSACVSCVLKQALTSPTARTAYLSAFVSYVLKQTLKASIFFFCLSQSLLPAIIELAEDKQWRVRQVCLFKMMRP